MPMLANDYQKVAITKSNPLLSRRAMLEEGLMGMNSGAGKCLDILKKHRFQNYQFDIETLAEEIGDVVWYLSEAAYALGYDLETILRTNLEKIGAHCPEDAATKNSIDRKAGDI